MIAHYEQGGEPPLPKSWDEARKACHRWLLERDPVYAAEHRIRNDRRGDYQRRMKRLKTSK